MDGYIRKIQMDKELTKCMGKICIPSDTRDKVIRTYDITKQVFYESRKQWEFLFLCFPKAKCVRVYLHTSSGYFLCI